MRNRGWCLFRGCRSQAFFFGFIPRCFCYRARRFFWFRRRRNVGRDLVGFIAPTFFFFADLRVEESSSDCARGERSCEPNAKAHHCDGAQQSARHDQLRRIKSCCARGRFGHGRRSRAHFFAFAAKNGVQLTAQQQQQTSEIHPSKQHDDGGQREIRRVVAIISRHIQLKKFGGDVPADRKENRAGQSLTDGQVIFGSEEIKRERENDQRHKGKGQIQRRNPCLQRKSQLKIDFCKTGQPFAEDDGVETEHDDNPKPKKHEK